MASEATTEREGERKVLRLIASGLILILLGIVAGIFFSTREPPLSNWAENVLVAIATASVLKLGDCLSALVALATGRQVARLGEQLGASAPAAVEAEQPSRQPVPGEYPK